jgi:biotin operon repressor
MIGKKVSIIYVLNMLKTCSSKEYPLSQALITRAINLAGIKCDRKTIARDIECLKMCGYKIIKNKGGGCYLYSEDELNNDEISLLEKLITTSSLDIRQKQDLLKKMRLFKKQTGIVRPKKNTEAYFREVLEFSNYTEVPFNDFDCFSEEDLLI